MQNEIFKGVGRKQRRMMIRLWKADMAGSKKKLSLKVWARNAPVGDVGHVWLQAKRGL